MTRPRFSAPASRSFNLVFFPLPFTKPDFKKMSCAVKKLFQPWRALDKERLARPDHLLPELLVLAELEGTAPGDNLPVETMGEVSMMMASDQSWVLAGFFRDFLNRKNLFL